MIARVIIPGEGPAGDEHSLRPGPFHQEAGVTVAGARQISQPVPPTGNLIANSIKMRNQHDCDHDDFVDLSCDEINLKSVRL